MFSLSKTAESLVCSAGGKPLLAAPVVWGVALRDPPAHPEARKGSGCGWSWVPGPQVPAVP